MLLACAAAPVKSADQPAAQSTAQSAPVAEAGERILEHGGELPLPGARDRVSGVDGDELFAWAQSEVPGDSRLQAAFALVDALARAELVKVVQVDLTATAEVSASASNGVESQSAAFAVRERARGLVRDASPPAHAWVKVERDGQSLLRVYARAKVVRPPKR